MPSFSHGLLRAVLYSGTVRVHTTRMGAATMRRFKLERGVGEWKEKADIYRYEKGGRTARERARPRRTGGGRRGSGGEGQRA